MTSRATAPVPRTSVGLGDVVSTMDARGRNSVVPIPGVKPTVTSKSGPIRLPESGTCHDDIRGYYTSCSDQTLDAGNGMKPW
jgi:hypothetical protein